ncbi:MAG: hypothetical protein LBD57_04400 [Endomicrobium sp.]|uniref:hypothetical protein n=1 Tax=Candidatus Endomicrobiellum cubanum TaxID=3242325 RepID=UPI00281FB658|nr:hypothetical protein [Endomicrobium sp.]
MKRVIYKVFKNPIVEFGLCCVSYILYKEIKEYFKYHFKARVDEKNYKLNNCVVFSDKKDAEEVLEALNVILKDCKTATVADFFTLVRAGCEYLDHKHGWISFEGVEVIQLDADEYKIDLPEPMLLF